MDSNIGSVHASVAQMEFPGAHPQGMQANSVPNRKAVGTERRSSSEQLSPHPLYEMVPSRTDKERDQLKQAMQSLTSDSPKAVVRVLVLGREVLWDYDRYKAALELGLEVEFVPYWGSDPVAFLCVEALHHRKISGQLTALFVVASHEWAKPGRPLNVTPGVTFTPEPKTNEQMADLAGVGTTLINQAKEIYAFGLSEQVLRQSLSFGEARRRIKLVRDSGLQQSVLDGSMTLDEAHQAADSSGTNSRTDAERKSPTKDQLAHELQNEKANSRRLEQQHVELEERVRHLTDENARIRKKLEKSERALSEQIALREGYEEFINQLKYEPQLEGVSWPFQTTGT